MLQRDGVETLHYVDPPYVLGTRVQGNGRACYVHEMSDEDHAELLAALRELQGMVIVSGYANKLYSNTLDGWRVDTTASRISAARGGASRTEMLWMNPACWAALERMQGGLFDAANGVAPVSLRSATRSSSRPVAISTTRAQEVPHHE